MAWLEGLAIIALIGAFLGVALWTRGELNDIARHGTERKRGK